MAQFSRSNRELDASRVAHENPIFRSAAAAFSIADRLFLAPDGFSMLLLARHEHGGSVHAEIPRRTCTLHRDVAYIDTAASRHCPRDSHYTRLR